MNMKELRIATRQSALALWQANHVAGRLKQHYPELVITLVPLSTRGDQILDRSLAQVGGKGLFLKELELAILSEDADIAVHSMKDVPHTLDEGLMISTVLQREDPSDAFVSNRYENIQALPSGARVGTSSLRRQIQLHQIRTDLVISDLRGNVNTRLQKLDDDQFDAVILASAGLKRLGLGSRIRSKLTMPQWIPAVAQGAIGIECCKTNQSVHHLLQVLKDESTSICLSAERAMSRMLDGNCAVPMGGYARLQGGILHLSGFIGDMNDYHMIVAEAQGTSQKAIALGEWLGQQLLMKLKHK